MLRTAPSRCPGADRRQSAVDDGGDEGEDRAVGLYVALLVADTKALFGIWRHISMYIHMYMCIIYVYITCIYINIDIYIYVYNMCIYVYMYIHVPMYACMYVYVKGRSTY